ncbi:MAG TPA: PepSY-like domain-containing protein [Candidatus Cryptobacteroides intestinipullorum]|nr:PepSY-like domain-containing protein [Candidatus Cryptobacteroides intestinipullorum]
MKKIIFVLASIMMTAGIASADNDRIIAFDQLPAKAREFVKQYFPSEKVSYVKEESDFMELSYEVVFAQGTKVEFSGQGEWKEVDCRYSTLNEKLVPAQIRDYVSKNFPDTKFVKIEKGYRGYEVKLTNRLELTFDAEYRLVDIDD